MSKEKEETKTKKKATTKTKVAAAKETAQKEIDNKTLLKEIANLVESEESPSVFELTGTEEEPINLDDITEVGLYIIKGKIVPVSFINDQNELSTYYLFVYVKDDSTEPTENRQFYQSLFFLYNDVPSVTNRMGVYDGEIGKVKYEIFIGIVPLRTSYYHMANLDLINSRMLHDSIEELITQFQDENNGIYYPISTLENLKTNDKSSLVNAINEVNNKINDINNGGEVTPTNSMYKELIGTDDNPINIDNVIENGMYILTGTITSTWEEQILEQLHENSENYMFVSKYFDEEKTSEMITQNLLYWNKKESCLGILSRICSVADYEAGRLNQWINKNLALNPKEYIDMEEGIVSNTDLRGMTSQLITEMYIDKNNNQYSVPVSTLKDLQTDDKSSLVNAINEINKKLNDMNGGGVPSNSAFQYLVGTEENPINLNDIIEPGMYIVTGKVLPIEYILDDNCVSNTLFVFVNEQQMTDSKHIYQTLLFINQNIPSFAYRVEHIFENGTEQWYTSLSVPIHLQVGGFMQPSDSFLVSSSELYAAMYNYITKFINNGYGIEKPISTLDDLNTENKESLVNAINEINQKLNNMNGGIVPTNSAFHYLIGTEDKPINLDDLTEKGMYIIEGKITASDIITEENNKTSTYFVFVAEQKNVLGMQQKYQTVLFSYNNIPTFICRNGYFGGAAETGYQQFGNIVPLAIGSYLVASDNLIPAADLHGCVTELLTEMKVDEFSVNPISKLTDLDTENKESLVNAINELKGEIDTLKAEIETLKSGE